MENTTREIIHAEEIRNNRHKELNSTWERFIEDLIDNIGTTESINKKGIARNCIENPFFEFANIFSEYVNSKNYVSNKSIKNALNEKIIMHVLEISTKILLDELHEFRRSMTKSYDSKKCYEMFSEALKDEGGVRELYNNNPLMFKVLAEGILKIVDYYIEIEENLKKDYESIRSTFGINGKLIKIENGMGDSHRGKKQVVILNFEDGKIVYKPRCMDIDVKFGCFLDYVNEKLNMNLKYPKVLSRNGYGWQEFIEYKESKDEEEVKQFYKEVGVFAGIFYLFMSSDIHMDNMIAAGNKPFFVDLESVFQCYVGHPINDDDEYGRIGSKIKNSILTTCMFPGHMNPTEVRDFSGITGCGGQIIPKVKYELKNKNSADMELVRGDYTVPEKQNIPSINGKKVNPRKYTNEIIDGFTRIYEFVQHNKIAFIINNGLIDNFKDCPIRVIFRDTSKYGVILKASTERKYLTDIVKRKELFERMWLITKEYEELTPVISDEIRDIDGGDVPYFYSYINASFIYNSLDKKVDNYEQKPLSTIIKKRINSLNDEDKNFQIELIKQSMAEPVKRWELKENKKSYISVTGEEEKTINEDVIMDRCKDVMEQIEKLSFQGNNDIGWVDLRISSGGQWVFLPMDNTLYEGTMGIALLAAQLYVLTGVDDYHILVNKILNSSEIYMNKYKARTSLSAFNGDVAVAYGYYYIGQLLKNDKLKAKAVEILLKCDTAITSDKDIDIISGAAGALIVALRINEKEDNPKLKEFAIKCGNHILNSVVNEEGKYGWHTAAGQGAVLAGMSHGNAGISWTLLELYNATKDERFLECAKKAIEYENTIFDPTTNNWMDKRSEENRKRKGFPEAVNWCHGAPGIGLSRIFCKKICPTIIDDKDIQNAYYKTKEAGFGGSDCICHGSLGNLELLIELYKLNGDKKYLDQALVILQDLIDEKEEDNWICGIPQRVYVPGFMTGLAGIGYELLRLMSPNEIPNVIKFELPV